MIKYHRFSINKHLLTGCEFTTNISMRGIPWCLQNIEICFQPVLCLGPCWRSSQCIPKVPSWLKMGTSFPFSTLSTPLVSQLGAFGTLDLNTFGILALSQTPTHPTSFFPSCAFWTRAWLTQKVNKQVAQLSQRNRARCVSFGQSGRLERGDNILRTLQVYFNHCDVTRQQSYCIRWKNAK